MFTKKSLARNKGQMKKFPDRARVHIEKAMAKNGEEAEKYMKALVPVDTGATQDSIFSYVKDVPWGIRLTIVAGDGEEAPARYVEFVNDQPFFYPVVRLNLKRWRGRISRSVNKAAKEIANG